MSEPKNNKGGFFSSLFSSKKKPQVEQKSSLKLNQEAILNNHTPFVIQEAYKTARTNIIFAVSGAKDKKSKVICFTSASPGEGKTTSCINLAITFAQTGARVLLIDGDMRKPRMHQYLGVVKTNGLSTVLSMQANFADVVYRNIRPNMDLLASGSIPPNPAELLGSEAMEAFLADISDEYDYVFIDTPPASVVTDAVALSKYVTGMIIVVREGYTTHENLEHAISMLKIADSKILGFFLNDSSPININYGVYQKNYGKYSPRYTYRYNYKYNYRYGSYRYGAKPTAGTSSEANDTKKKEE